MSVVTAPIRKVRGHQGFEELAVAGDTKMEKFVDDHEILEAIVLIR